MIKTKQIAVAEVSKKASSRRGNYCLVYRKDGKFHRFYFK